MGFQLPTWLTSNPVLQADIAQAEAAGKAILTSAYNYAQGLAAHVQTGFANDLTTAETDVEAKLLDFVPSAERASAKALIDSVAAGTESTLNPEIVAWANNSLGFVLARLKGALGQGPITGVT